MIPNEASHVKTAYGTLVGRGMPFLALRGVRNLAVDFGAAWHTGVCKGGLRMRPQPVEDIFLNDQLSANEQ